MRQSQLKGVAAFVLCETRLQIYFLAIYIIYQYLRRYSGVEEQYTLIIKYLHFPCNVGLNVWTCLTLRPFVSSQCTIINNTSRHVLCLEKIMHSLFKIDSQSYSGELVVDLKRKIYRYIRYDNIIIFFYNTIYTLEETCEEW